MPRTRIVLAAAALIAVPALAGCLGADDAEPAQASPAEGGADDGSAGAAGGEAGNGTADASNATQDLPTVERTVVAEDIIPHQPPQNYTYNVEGSEDTTIEVPVNSTVKLTMVSHEQNALAHDIRSDSLGVDTDTIDPGEELTVTFNVTEPGPNVYWCDVGDHRDRGMEGVILVTAR